MNADEKQLRSALRALARQEEGLAARPHIEARLMRAWDERRGSKVPRRRTFIGPVLKLAAALVLAASGAYWWSRSGANPPIFPDQREQPTVTSWPSSETLPWLDPEPGSLQIVHVRVAGVQLAPQGYAVSDPLGDGGLVDLEVILAADGTARGVRVAMATAIY